MLSLEWDFEVHKRLTPNIKSDKQRTPPQHCKAASVIRQEHALPYFPCVWTTGVYAGSWGCGRSSASSRTTTTRLTRAKKSRKVLSKRSSAQGSAQQCIPPFRKETRPRVSPCVAILFHFSAVVRRRCIVVAVMASALRMVPSDKLRHGCSKWKFRRRVRCLGSEERLRHIGTHEGAF